MVRRWRENFKSERGAEMLIILWIRSRDYVLSPQLIFELL